MDNPWERSPKLAVCKRCHYTLSNSEQSCRGGEFYHPLEDRKGNPINCVNAGKYFELDEKRTELEPFERKSVRRRAKRAGTSV